MAEKKHNIFISHYGEDERQLDSLKQRLRDHGCDIRNSSVEKKKYRPYKVTNATIARYLRICILFSYLLNSSLPSGTYYGGIALLIRS
jgi:hypothetical protein